MPPNDLKLVLLTALTAIVGKLRRTRPSFTNGDLVIILAAIRDVTLSAHAREDDPGDAVDPELLFGLGQIAGLACKHIERHAATD